MKICFDHIYFKLIFRLYLDFINEINVMMNKINAKLPRYLLLATIYKFCFIEHV